MKMTPTILLGLLLAVSMGCTPSKDSTQARVAQTPIEDSGDQNQGSTLQDQELALESVGLKFIIDHHQQEDQNLVYVSWDQFFREEWLDQHGQSGLQQQAAELELYLTLAETEHPNAFDQELVLKKNLVKLTLKNLK